MNLSSDEESDEFSSRAPSYLDNLDEVEWEDGSLNENTDTETDTVWSTAQYAATNNNRSTPLETGSSETSNIQYEIGKKKRRLNKLSHVSSDTQKLLSILHKSHLLLRTYHSIILSNSCSSDTMLLHVSLSLVPSTFVTQHKTNMREKEEYPIYPSISLLESFVQWFYSFTDLKAVRERRAQIRRSNQVHGAPIYPSYSSTIATTTKSKAKRRGLIMNQGTDNDPWNYERYSTNSSTKILKGWTELRKKLMEILIYLSPTQDDNPEYMESFIDMTSYEKVWLFICMARYVYTRCV